jgi:hypothetical protein
MMFRNISSAFFTQELWRNGYIGDLGLQCRYADITSSRGKDILREHAVGYCKGENLWFRSKANEVAIMCYKDGRHFWFHIRRKEFDEVFGSEILR